MFSQFSKWYNYLGRYSMTYCITNDREYRNKKKKTLPIMNRYIIFAAVFHLSIKNSLELITQHEQFFFLSTSKNNRFVFQHFVKCTAGDFISTMYRQVFD